MLPPILYPDTGPNDFQSGLSWSANFYQFNPLSLKHSGSTSYLFSLKAFYPTGSIVVEMFGQGLPSGRWGGTLRVWARLIIRGDELQSDFVLIAE